MVTRFVWAPVLSKMPRHLPRPMSGGASVSAGMKQNLSRRASSAKCQSTGGFGTVGVGAESAPAGVKGDLSALPEK